MRYVGTSSKGIRLPILKTGDNLKQIVNDTSVTVENLKKFSEKLNKRFLLFRLMF